MDFIEYKSVYFRNSYNVNILFPKFQAIIFIVTVSGHLKVKDSFWILAEICHIKFAVNIYHKTYYIDKPKGTNLQLNLYMDFIIKFFYLFNV